MMFRVTSGGQTGVDRAALDAAMALDISVCGWCPAGRLAEDGHVPACYPLVEMPGGYHDRTVSNVRDSDGTLIVAEDRLTGGSLLTLAECRRQCKPVYVVRLGVLAMDKRMEGWEVARIGRWFIGWLHPVREVPVLNCAGPRESKAPGVGSKARVFLDRVFACLMVLPNLGGHPGAIVGQS
jgi:hypothetical protein